MKPIVLCIDRDNDIGRSTRVQGPVIGWKKNIEVAEALALVDPEDSDVNAIFAAVKLARKLDTEVVTLTGDSKVGFSSDKKIANQLDNIIKKLKPTSVILVSDGADDEQVIPIIQSRINIDYVETVIVRQSKELEKAYFKIIHFFREISKAPDVARLVFGVPGIALVLLAIGGMQAVSLIIGVVGAYLILRGLGFEEALFDRIMNFVKSLSTERVSTLIYIVGLVMLVFGVIGLQSDLTREGLTVLELVSSVDGMASFILNASSIDLIALALITGMIGHIIDDYASKNYLKIRKYLMLLALVILVRVTLQAGATFIDDPQSYGLATFVLHMVFGVIAFMAWIKVTEYWFLNEIKTMKNIIKDMLGKEVVNKENEHIGRVSKVILEGLELKALRIGRRVIDRKDIIETGEKIRVNAS